jgi:hypothetical protein
MAEMEAQRMLMLKRGNLQREISQIGEEASEGTEIQTITMFKLMKAFEKVMLACTGTPEQARAYRGALQLYHGRQPRLYARLCAERKNGIF